MFLSYLKIYTKNPKKFNKFAQLLILCSVVVYLLFCKGEKMQEILRLKNVSFNYHTETDEIEAIKDLNINIKNQEFVSIVGPSGCGKTTILSLIADILKPSSGTIQFFTKSENKQDLIGYMFQRDHLFDWNTVWKNINLGLELKNKQAVKNAEERLEDLLKKYGLIEFKNHKPWQLSGGMRQRVALIRTLALNPEILLLDEPFSALDYQTRLKVCDDVSNIITSEKKTAILVTHDISEAISLSDKVIVLSKRPATVKTIFKIDLKKYGSPLKRRECPEFHPLFDKVWQELQYEE